MKLKKCIILLVNIFLIYVLHSQSLINNPFKTNVFIPDSGQFKEITNSNAKIYFGTIDEHIYFTPNSFFFDFIIRNKLKENEEEEKKKDKIKIKHYHVSCEFLNSNTKKIQPLNPTTSYYTFGEKGVEHIKFKGFQQIRYQQLYKGVDAYFYFPNFDSVGIKYFFKVFPNTDYKQIQLKWTGIKSIEIDNNNLKIKTKVGDIYHYNLKAYYLKSHRNLTINWTLINKNTIGFNIKEPIENDTLIIDPWIVSPNSLTNNQNAYDIDYDIYDNAYVFGGSYPYKLAKYSPNGTLLWTYTIPNSFSSSYQMYSEHSVLKTSGSVYIGEGLISSSPNPRVIKVSTNGTQIFMNTINNSNNEIWTIFYNQCSGKMMAFGGGNAAAMYNTYVFSDTNLTSVSMINSNGVTNVPANDIADAVLDNNGDFFALIASAGGHPQNGYIYKSLFSNGYNAPPSFAVSSGYTLDEICSMSIFPASVCHGLNQSNRMNALALNSSYLFSYDGKTLKAWNKTTGLLLAQVVVNAAYASGFNRSHEGIAVDECNRIYVGGYQTVHSYSFTGNSFIPLSNITSNVPNEVFDIMLNESTSTLFVSGKGFVSTHTVNSCNSLSLSILTSNSCGSTGTATAIVSGGTPPYSYLWSTGATTSVVTNLSPGTYSILVHDASCIGKYTTSNFTITGSTTNFSVTHTLSPPSCFGYSNGSATISVNGGTAPYSYTWMPSNSTSSIATNLSAGTYTVNIQDVSGCSTVHTLTLNQPPDMTVQAIPINSISCFNGSDGSASVTVSGGTSPYSCNWTPGNMNTFTVSGLSSIVYTVTITDSNLCAKSTTLSIPQPSSLTILTNTPIACYGNTAVVTATINGGTGNYSYTWSPGNLTGQSSYTLSNILSNQQVSLTVADNNCPPQSTTINVNVLQPLTATGSSYTICNNTTINLFPQIISPGNGGPYSYYWVNNGATSSYINVIGNSNTPIQTFTVQISDGCTIPDANAVFTITTLPFSFAPVNIYVSPNQGCSPLNVTYSFNSNDSITNFQWYFGNNNTSTYNPTTITYTNSGIYSPTLTLTNQYGCKKDTVLSNIVNVFPVPIAAFECLPSYSASVIDASITFTNLSTPNDSSVNFTWNFGDPCSFDNFSTETNPVHEYTCPGTFTVLLIATNQYGCMDTSIRIVWIKPEIHLYIPNCFTPNGDGLNDIFQPKGMGIVENDYKLLIFDRWGEEIFESNEFSIGWDGKVKKSNVLAAEGVYVYKIYCKDIRGRAYEFVGHVTCLPTKTN